ncbi:MAG: hypothetical protein EHM81_00915 [Chloroflexi bacterium]|nr:MAG: hypothetical protein EHM81_00915 [Chloroflexota bacterium]
MASCAPHPSEDGFAGDHPTDSSATPTLDFSFDSSRAACQASSECVLMKIGGCENVDAIHVSQVEFAQAYSERSKEKYKNVVCAPSMPIEDYEPLCLNRKCRAALKDYRLLLEAPEQPVAGKSFWLGMGFRFPRSQEQVDARFLLPQDMTIVSGQANWSGPVEAGQEVVLWVEVLTDKPGEAYLTGWAGISQGETSIPPLTWSQTIEVAAPQALTPWPERERILPTPTP